MIEPERVEAQLDSLARPPGRPRRLVEPAVRLGSIQGTLQPQTRPRRVIMFADGAGIAAQGGPRRSRVHSRMRPSSVGHR